MTIDRSAGRVAPGDVPGYGTPYPGGVTQNDDAETDSSFFDLVRSPWAQGVLTGALTLIPARNYPRWLRLSLIWAPTIVGAGGLALLAANPDAQRRFAVDVGADQQRGEEPEENTVQQADAPTILKVAGAGAAGGAVASAAMAVSFWADEKLERGLRQLKAPFPRVVMGVMVGAATGRWVIAENKRDRCQFEKSPSRGPDVTIAF